MTSISTLRPQNTVRFGQSDAKFPKDGGKDRKVNLTPPILEVGDGFKVNYLDSPPEEIIVPPHFLKKEFTSGGLDGFALNLEDGGDDFAPTPKKEVPLFRFDTGKTQGFFNEIQVAQAAKRVFGQGVSVERSDSGDYSHITLENGSVVKVDLTAQVPFRAEKQSFPSVVPKPFLKNHIFNKTNPNEIPQIDLDANNDYIPVLRFVKQVAAEYRDGETLTVTKAEDEPSIVVITSSDNEVHPYKPQ